MNIDKTLFFICGFWYLFKYGPTFIDYYIKFFYYKLYNYFQEIKEKNKDVNNDIIEEHNSNKNNDKPLPKYEDKYLEQIRKLNKEWIFTEEEIQKLPNLVEDFYNDYIGTRKERIEEINRNITKLEDKIQNDKDKLEYTEVNDFEEEYIEDYDNEYTLEERNNYRRQLIEDLNRQKSGVETEIYSEDGIKNIKEKSEQFANEHIINKKKEKLKNCYVMEKTPQGNVLMIYNIDRDTFTYYSDSSIPYRYLEVVGRKFVKMYNCRPLFVDMEEELRLFEEKWEEMRNAKEEEKKKVDEAKKIDQVLEPKKNVFAKFKSYNKDAGGKISMAPPPKNSIPNKTTSESKENEKIILKERANCYTYEGKFANFNFLQKIEKKVFNKKLGFSFADFKKMKQQK
jgi:hypothetical protein